MTVQRMKQDTKESYAGIVVEWEAKSNQDWLANAKSLGMIAELQCLKGNFIGYSSYNKDEIKNKLPAGFFDKHMTYKDDPYGGGCAERHCLMQVAEKIYSTTFYQLPRSVEDFKNNVRRARALTSDELATELKNNVKGGKCLAVNGHGYPTAFCAGCQTVVAGTYGVKDLYSEAGSAAGVAWVNKNYNKWGSLS